MMTLTGKSTMLTLCLLLLTASATSHAAIDANIDRKDVNLGDTLQLVLSATEDDEELATVDLSALEQDFQVLSRSTRSNTSIVNGRRSHNRQLQIEITPLRTGTLLIPAFSIGAQRTTPIPVRVDSAPKIQPGEETVLFDVTTDRSSVYVQGQVILTLRLQQAINLDERTISELTLPDAFVVPLEQKSFQRNVDGRTWLVHEVRYAIFPEQSGVLNIPAQTFSARTSAQRRSLFDSARGRLLSLRSEPLQLEVLPQPASFTGASWLPARNLVVEEDWSAPTDQLVAGESVTRTIRLRAEGVQGAQLPPVLLQPIDGIKHYPDQPAIADDEISSGLQGSRRDSVAIVPTRAGSIEIPAVEIPWWDTDAGVMRKTIIPARSLQVAAAVTDPMQPAAATNPAAGTGAPGAAVAQVSALPWQLLALLCAAGWILTALLWFRSNKQTDHITPVAQPRPTGKAAFKTLLAACASDQPAQARKAVIQWAATLADDDAITSLQKAAEAFNDSELTAELEALEKALYGNGRHDWRGNHLRTIAEHLQSRHKNIRVETDAALRLYPSG